MYVCNLETKIRKRNKHKDSNYRANITGYLGVICDSDNADFNVKLIAYVLLWLTTHQASPGVLILVAIGLM